MQRIFIINYGIIFRIMTLDLNFTFNNRLDFLIDTKFESSNLKIICMRDNLFLSLSRNLKAVLLNSKPYIILKLCVSDQL
jgi:hypothetical protein